MKQLIPHFIHDASQKGIRQGEFIAFTMFVDLSGFTSLTESLMAKGTRGAEQLSFTLNEIFGPLVKLVYARGGFIPYFAGDAFVVLFPEGKNHVTPNEFVRTAAAMRDLFQQREYRFGNFTIGIKIGLSHGKVSWGIVGDQHKAFYFRGASIESCSQIQNKAKHQDILFDQLFKDRWDGHGFSYEQPSEHCYRLCGEMPPLEAVDLPVLSPPQPEIVAQFLPPAVMDYEAEGEFRTIVTIFISFSGLETHEELNHFATLVLDQIQGFSGYFKEIDFSDKGGVIVAFFGAPISFENNVNRALEFMDAVQVELREKLAYTDARIRAGITSGMAFTGIVGGRERCQYAAVGNRVNLAARLMTFASWNEVMVDDEICKNRHFAFQHAGNIKYKGIKGPVPTYKLTGRQYNLQSAHFGRMVGRKREIEQLTRFAQPLFSGRPAGVAFVYGEAGIGKSRLMHELRMLLLSQGKLGWHVCQVDQILRKPFNPFIFFLRNFFNQSPEAFASTNQERFEARFDQLLDAVRATGTPQAEGAIRELGRTKSVLAALAGINYADSLWEELDAKGRYQNTFLALINLIQAGALIEPLVIELEDGHWLDEHSEELLLELLRHLGRHPIMLLVTSRYSDDGAKPPIVDRAMLETLKLPYFEVHLHTLEPQSVRSLAEMHLGGTIHVEFLELLLRATNSNPFYLEQILEYFVESGLVVKEKDEWNIRDKNIRLSNSINAILTARIDRLSSLVKETVKAAAVIGREFDLPILSEVMLLNEEFIRHNGDTSLLLREQVNFAERGQIWLAMNELRYIFRHSLLREAAYSMQLRTRLQNLHLMIAQVIERLYGDNLEERFVDLAFHYEQANVPDKTMEYLRKAADFAHRNYQNHQALDFYERLLLLQLKHAGPRDQIMTYLKKGRILEMVGQWERSVGLYHKALELAREMNDLALLGSANNHYGRVLMLQGDYANARGYLQTSVQLFETASDVRGMAKAYGDLGNLYFRQGVYQQAKYYFKESITLSQSSAGGAVDPQIVANLGLTYMNEGDFDEGIRYQLSQLEWYEKQGHKPGLATLYTYLGIVYLEKGELQAALRSFHSGLEYSEALGNKMLTSIAMGNIGLVYERQGDYEKAMDNYVLDLRICEEIGDKQGTAIALGLIGQLLNVKGEFYKAIEYLQKDLMLCEELGYQKGIAKAVNTLGDVFYNLKQYERSLHFYDRAIEVTRKIGNKLVLGMSLVEKGAVLLALNDADGLQAVRDEALALALELGNPDLLFEARLFSTKVSAALGSTEEAAAALHELLENTLPEEHRAAVYLQLYRIFNDNDAYRRRALDMYSQLYKITPSYAISQYISELSATPAKPA